MDVDGSSSFEGILNGCWLIHRTGPSRRKLKPLICVAISAPIDCQGDESDRVFIIIIINSD